MQYPMDTIHHITRPLFRQKIGKTLKEMKRSDASWRFTCGNVYIFFQTKCSWDFSPSGRDAEKFSFWKYTSLLFIFSPKQSATETFLPLGETLKSFWSLFTFSNLDLLLSGPRVFTRCFILFWLVIFPPSWGNFDLDFWPLLLPPYHTKSYLQKIVSNLPFTYLGKLKNVGNFCPWICFRESLKYERKER